MLGFPGLAVVQVVTTHSTAPDGLALAGINGTILAILIAALSGYALIVFQSLDRMQTDLIDHANQINSLPNINRTSGYFETEGRDSRELLNLLMNLVLDQYHGVSLGLPDPFDEEQRPLRGQIMLAILSAIVEIPPFKGNHLATEDKVRAWADELSFAVKSLQGSLAGFADKADQLATAQDQGFELWVLDQELAEHPEDREIIERRRGEVTEETVARQLLEQFRFFLGVAINIARQVETDLDRIDRYRSNLPLRWVIPAAAVVLATFVCGVAIPMISPTVPKGVDAWFPGFVYVAALAVALGFGGWRYAARASRHRA